MKTEIRITDPYIRKLVEEERQRRGDNNPTKTAARMLSEYAALLKLGKAERPTRELQTA